jgi:gamma-glutamyl hercynylcysteine S-oxide synthase
MNQAPSNQPLPERASASHAARAAYSPLVREADKEVLSLALMDARNYTLAMFEAFEPLAASGYVVAADCDVPSPLWLLGKLAWQQEWMTLRYDSAAGMATALPMLEDADALFQTDHLPTTLPPANLVKTYCFDVMQAMLDSLSNTDDSDEALHPYRSALFLEDQCTEQLHVALQALDLHEVPVCRSIRRYLSVNQAILLPDYRFTQGVKRTDKGFAFDEEYEAHEVAVPAFEIDAALISWAQFADFISDGGYDEPAHWSREGLAWLTQTDRRVPLYVEQAGSQVIAKRFGKLLRVDLREPVRHVTLWEAQAYARWAGRRLPAEVEWARAALGAQSQGFSFGALHEWTASRYREWPGYVDGNAARYALPSVLNMEAQIVRGASFATSPRLCDARVRQALAPEAAHQFVGFRTCAL